MTQPHDSAYSRDQDQKPGRPPRGATEPAGAERSTRSAKTMTDPGSGEPRRTPPKPNRARADDRR